MGFELNISFGNKKEAKKDIQISNNSPIEQWGSLHFYPQIWNSINKTVLRSMYNDLPEISIPVNFIVDSLTTIPINHYRILNSGDEELINDSSVLQILKKPNQYNNRADYIKLFFLNRLVLGGSYVNAVKALGFNGASQLYVLPTLTTEPVLLNSKATDFRLNQISGYTSIVNNANIEFEAEEVFQQLEASLNDDNYYIPRSRLSSSISLSKTLRYNYEARLKSFIDRGATGIISPKSENETISKDNADQMRKKWFEENGIIGDKFPFLISPRSMDFTRTSLGLDELKLNETRTQDFALICNQYSIDPALFGIGNNTYNNKKLAKTAFYEDVIIPMMDSFLEFHNEIFELPENETLRADYTGIAAMQEDYNTTVNSLSKLYTDGVISEREYREGAGFEGGSEEKRAENQAVNQTSQENN